LTRKIALQSAKARSTPATSGPRAAARGSAPITSPSRRPSLPGGAVALSSAIPFGKTRAPATACWMRNAIRIGRFGASPAPSDDRPNQPRPASKSVRRPRRSPSFPATGCSDAIAMRYPVTSQPAEERSVSKSTMRWGSATAIMVELSGTSIAPRTIVKRTFRPAKLSEGEDSGVTTPFE
jgi:hypothetical protein